MTICPNYAFKEILEVEMFQGNSSLGEIESKVKRNIWPRNETFYFLDFPTDKTPGFPCMTTEESVDPNKPCMFPFMYKYKGLANVKRFSFEQKYSLFNMFRIQKLHLCGRG